MPEDMEVLYVGSLNVDVIPIEQDDAAQVLLERFGRSMWEASIAANKLFSQKMIEICPQGESESSCTTQNSSSGGVNLIGHGNVIGKTNNARIKLTSTDVCGSSEGINSFDTNNILSLSHYTKPLADFLENLNEVEKVGSSYVLSVPVYVHCYTNLMSC
ncbi:hypothetical protein ACET3Z_001927 [Daucus carota]